MVDFPQDYPCHLALSVFNLIINQAISRVGAVKVFMLRAYIPTCLQHSGICKPENNDLEEKEQKNR